MAVVNVLPSNSADPRQSSATVRVYTKRTWAEQYWILQPEVQCDGITLTTGDKVSTCQLSRKYGPKEKPFGESAFRSIPRVDWQDYRVLIEVTRASVTKAFYFSITRQQDNIRKRYKSGETEGTQIFGGHGIELELLRTRIETSEGYGTNAAAGVLTELTSGVPAVFNDPNRMGTVSSRPKPNRHAKAAGAGVFRFDFDYDALPGFSTPLTQGQYTARHWTVDQIVRHLLRYYTPTALGRGLAIQWEMHFLSNLAFPVYNDPDNVNARPIIETPVLDPKGKSLQQCLSEVLNRRRLYGFRVFVEEPLSDLIDLGSGVKGKKQAAGAAAAKAKFDVFRLLSEDLTLADGTRLFANGRAKSIAINSNVHSELSVQESTDGRFTRVVVRGARARVVFSASTQSLYGNPATRVMKLGQAWATSTETAYKQAATTQDGYNAKTLEDRRRLNESVRLDPSLKTAFARYAILPDRTTGDVHAKYTLLSRLPLSPSSEQDRERGIAPLVWIKDLDGQYRAADTIAAQNEMLGKFAQRTWACSVFVEEGTPFLWVRANPQHALGKPNFVPLVEDELIDTALNFQDDILATLAREEDHYCEGVFSDANQNNALTSRTLVVDLGPSYFYDVAEASTYLGARTAAGELIPTNAQTVLRDDRVQLAELARIIHEQQAKVRRDCDLQFDQIELGLEIGDLLDSVGLASESDTAATTAIKAVITEIRYTFGDRQSTSIRTDHGELDYTYMIEPSATTTEVRGVR